MAESTKIDFIYLSEPDMVAAGVTDMSACVDTMEEMFGLLYHGDYRMAGANNNSHGSMVLFPEESPFPNMPKPTPDRRFMAMPAYLGGGLPYRRNEMVWLKHREPRQGPAAVNPDVRPQRCGYWCTACIHVGQSSICLSYGCGSRCGALGIWPAKIPLL